jgi:hypothetical protein
MVVWLVYEKEGLLSEEPENKALAAYLGWPRADLRGDAFISVLYSNVVTGFGVELDPSGLGSVVNEVPLQAALQGPGLQFYNTYLADGSSLRGRI